MNAATTLTLANAVLPKGRLLRDALLVTGFSALIGLSSQVAVPLPFTPVPMTLQTLAVLLAGMTLGWKRGSLAVVAWIAQGVAGLPVFAAYGMFTGGYVVGFLAAAALVGALAERRWDRRPATTVLAMVLGLAVIYACGVAWLSVFVGFPMAVLQGVVPFLLGEVVKVGAATAALPLAWRLVGGRAGR